MAYFAKMSQILKISFLDPLKPHLRPQPHYVMPINLQIQVIDLHFRAQNHEIDIAIERGEMGRRTAFAIHEVRIFVRSVVKATRTVMVGAL